MGLTRPQIDDIGNELDILYKEEDSCLNRTGTFNNSMTSNIIVSLLTQGCFQPIHEIVLEALTDSGIFYNRVFIQRCVDYIKELAKDAYYQVNELTILCKYLKNAKMLPDDQWITTDRQGDVSKIGSNPTRLKLVLNSISGQIQSIADKIY